MVSLALFPGLLYGTLLAPFPRLNVIPVKSGAEIWRWDVSWSRSATLGARASRPQGPDLGLPLFTFVPLEKGDHRGSSAVNPRPPAAKSAASPLSRGTKIASPGPASDSTRGRPARNRGRRPLERLPARSLAGRDARAPRVASPFVSWVQRDRWNFSGRFSLLDLGLNEG